MKLPSFIDDIKGKINEAPIVKNLKDKVNEYTSRQIEVKVCMLGARGVGKTSVLTSIFYDGNSKDGFYGTSIRLYAKPETSAQLTQQRGKLEDVFKFRNNISAIGASSGVSEFFLQMGLLGQDPNINLTITDYPGELILSDKKYVAERIKESHVVIVAIDSPYLMEDNGMYDEEKNQTTIIKKFLKENVGTLSEKLVLFVPLKCEKYLDINTPIESRCDLSQELSDRVEETYRELIKQLKKQQNVAVAITPILTMGGVSFSNFEINSEGGHGAKYKFYDGETEDGTKAKYSPLFCSQPIFYTLSFVTRQYMLRRNSANMIGVFLQNFENVDDFYEEMTKIDKRRLNGTNGYRVLAGNELFFTKNV